MCGFFMVYGGLSRGFSKVFLIIVCSKGFFRLLLGCS